ncbi:hypothetical protein F0U60_06240 [Archangium minus]|uniref:Lipoprotein n=1 Tax=Archangium minus TaxID=83450 RepID=A0ABY9WKD4_9BACT|nr:hypothetical protein F0U60_06240 [Archangium minus]
MQTGRFISGALLVMGLMLAGCGGAQGDDFVGEDRTSREVEAQFVCRPGDLFATEFYSDATRTTLVGYRACDCSGYLTSWGRMTPFTIELEPSCIGSGPAPR